MSYPVSFAIPLGTAGLTLTAQVKDATGTTLSPTTTIVDEGAGTYSCKLVFSVIPTLPVNVKIYQGATFTGAMTTINDSDFPGSEVDTTAVASAILSAATSGYTAGTVGGQIDRLGTGQVTVLSPVAQPTSDITISAGADYLAATNNPLEWTSTDWPDLTGATVTFRPVVQPVFTKTGSVVTPTGTAKIRVELTATDTSTLNARVPAHIAQYTVTAVLAGGSTYELVPASSLFIES